MRLNLWRGANWVLALALVLWMLAGCFSAVPDKPSSVSQPSSSSVDQLSSMARLSSNDEPNSVAAAGERSDELPEDGTREEGENAEGSTTTPMATPNAPVDETVQDPATPAEDVRVVALDPGHGGPEVGAASAGLAEKAINLEIALNLAQLLREQGYRVVLTRETDQAVSLNYVPGSYAGGTGRDLQARVDIANAASADLFISIHNNGSADPSQSGTEVWYNKDRGFADRNLGLARLVQRELLRKVRALGYPSFDRGIKDDSNFRVFRGRVFNLFVLGPGDGARPHVPTQMPGVLGESLFLSNPGDAAMLRQDRTLDAIAQGYLDAIVAYFDQYPERFPGSRE